MYRFPVVFVRFGSALRASLCAAAAVFCLPVSGQVLRQESTPNTVWLDLRLAEDGARPQTVPAWLDALETEAISLPLLGTDGAFTAPATVHRLRVTRVADAEAILVRLYFDDQAGISPTISAWDELGNEIAQSGQLGEGLGLPNAKAVVIPTAKLNYLEITVPGDGRTVRGAQIAWLTRHELWRPLDVTSAPTTLEPFRALRSEARPGDGEDRYRNGVVTAVLQEGTLKLSESGGAVRLPFEIERAPLMALVTFEVLGADLEHPPEIRLNGRYLGEAQYAAPDLADPALRGELSDSRAGVGFRYAGWIRATRLVPTLALSNGSNLLEVTAKSDGGEIAVRRIDIQLKYPFEQLDLAPVQTSASR